VKLGNQPVKGLGSLDRIQVFPLDIFNKGDFERIPGSDIFYQGRDFFQTGQRRRPPSPLSGNKPERPVTDPETMTGCSTSFFYGGAIPENRS
jgi:hypothetical protein